MIPRTEVKVSAVWLCPDLDEGFAPTLKQYIEILASLDDAVELNIVCRGDASSFGSVVGELVQGTGVSASILTLGGPIDESKAVSAGIDQSSGDVIVLLPSYLQSDPAAIPRMLDEIEQGADYVASWRTPRVDAGWGSGVSRAFNRFVRTFSGVALHDLNSALRVVRRPLAEAVPVYGDLYRFWPVLAARRGFRVVEVPVRHLEERRGPGHLGVGAYARRLLDILALFFLIKFTEKPLRFFGLLGAGAFAVGALIGCILAVQRLLGVALSDRPMLVFAVLLVVLGIQVIALGLLGELIIFTRSRQKRDYAIEQVYQSNSIGPPRDVSTASRPASLDEFGYDELARSGSTEKQSQRSGPAVSTFAR